MSGGFEEKLNNILNDQQAMGQIMALARSLSGTEGEDGPAEGSRQEEWVRAQPDREETGPELQGLDPALMRLGMRLLGEYNRKDERATALLTALRPYLRRERQDKLDRAVTVAKLSRVVTLLLRGMGNGGEEDV